MREILFRGKRKGDTLFLHTATYKRVVTMKKKESVLY